MINILREKRENVSTNQEQDVMLLLKSSNNKINKRRRKYKWDDKCE